MRKTLISTLLIFAAVLTLNAQEPFNHYIPKGAVTPLHTENNQLYLALGYGLGLNVNASFSFLEHFFVFATVTPHVAYSKQGTLPYDLKFEPWGFSKNDLSTSGGFGYFKRYNKISLEVLIGRGFSRVDNSWWFESLNRPHDTDAQYLTGFLQFNFGYQLEPISFGLATRFTTNQYKYLNTKVIGETFIETAEFLKFRSLNYIEPALFVEWNFWRQLSLNVQAGVAFPSNPMIARYVLRRTESDGYQNTINSELDLEAMVLFGRIGFNYKFNLK